MLRNKLKENDSSPSNEHYEPLKFSLSISEEYNALEKLLSEKSNEIHVVDRIDNQLKELIKYRNLGNKSLDDAELNAEVENFYNTKKIKPEEYGNWFYYPWANKIVHLLPKEDFIDLRTSRNKYKITNEEQDQLIQKKIGIVGLSVGNSVALTFAMERICGELILADFDELELSNLNRIRGGVLDLGINKTVIAARQITEVDPYIKVKVYKEGIGEKNIDAFLLEDKKLDMLVEVCDDIAMKFLIREKAKINRIPVVMDTNDRGMIDVERYDLEPNRAIFHGATDDVKYHQLDDLSLEEKISLVKRMVDFDQLSERMRFSFSEIGKSISSWPQLASGVNLGGAITTELCRKILLDQHKLSGRYYVDLDQIFS